jgi:hypothetical protein
MNNPVRKFHEPALWKVLMGPLRTKSFRFSMLGFTGYGGF